ncbi:FAD-dependent oxidoreductase [Microbulbifer yueqingensis]|uniref:Rubredoxin-NAD+ reductase n=1 Tax=Microbulbifer yueqingensis TaxID=658219 RepID=A0A1G8X8F6_9GAMM|nr:FAD-dependent oxidoreductase [Microbulbifer yueqingensis]SDJ86892.1 rubredoxin-NAD+ reductase [Microbulbifer yueqingensis]
MTQYRVWECQICGWIYDESKGWPEDGIAPGTRWEDIPEHWSCPECGAAKAEFLMLEVEAASEPPRPSVTETDTRSAADREGTIPARQTGTRIWECMVCGWVYDEAKGWPEDGIAPGTRWEDIPEDWCCPQCGVGKDEFDMVLVSGGAEAAEPATPAAPEIDSDADPLVIIGTGLAGYNLAREFRKLDRTTPLVLVTADDGTFYSKPLLSASLAHGKTPQQLATSSAEEMARELHAEILVHTQVDDIDAAARTLTLVPANGSHRASLRYARLVLATGASCRPLPPIEGDGLARLFRVNSLDDYHGFRTALANRRRVLLLGAGLIGCEFANDLVQAGYEVDVVDPLGWPLATILPETAGRDLRRKLEAAGVHFHTGSRLERLERRGTGLYAQLDNGKAVEADLALAALGLQANTGLAQAAGLEVGRGIRVDRQLRTSDENIFALGDCAEVDGHLLYFVAPLMACARSLAQTLAGSPSSVQYGAIPVAVKTTLRPTTVCPPGAGAEGEWQVQADSDGVQAEFRDGSGRLLGFALTGSRITARDALVAECAPLMKTDS